MANDNDYAKKAAAAARRITEAEDKKTEAERRLEIVRRTQTRFDYLDAIQRGQADTRRRYAYERYIG